jgi:hypothetical protein
MDLLKRSDLEMLIQKRDELCISLYMPTFRKGKKTKQNAIRFKNLLHRVKRRLAEHGLKAPVVVDLMRPAEKLLEDSLFWQHQSNGLAIFFSAESFRSYRLPISFEERAVVVSRQFHIKPLLRLFEGNGRFYILAASQNSLRLLQGTHFALHEVDLQGTDTPQSLSEALPYEDPEKQLQYHTGTTSRVGERAALYHGQGIGRDEKKSNILRYFREIDRGLNEVLQNESAPLIFAGVDYLFAIYQEANSYDYLADQSIEGNPDDLGDERLHREAWKIVSPLFSSAQQQALEAFGNLSRTERTSDSITEVLPAAHEGRVEVLFIAPGEQKWGTYDPIKRAVSFHNRKMMNDYDLVDACAAQTLLHSGAVYTVEKEEMPGSGDLAALFRY